MRTVLPWVTSSGDNTNPKTANADNNITANTPSRRVAIVPVFGRVSDEMFTLHSLTANIGFGKSNHSSISGANATDPTTEKMTAKIPNSTIHGQPSEI